MPPTQIRPYPRRRKTVPHINVPPVDVGVFKEYQALKINIGLAEREILMMVYILNIVKTHRTEASRQLYITRIKTTGFYPA
jgi:hypothetical protein